MSKGRERAWLWILVLFVGLWAILGAAQEAAPPAKWALVVGVESYPDLHGHDLSYSCDDAQAVYDFLIGPGGLTEDHVRLLLDEEATLVGVRGGLYWLRQRAQPDDLVIFYFSRHGYQGKDDDGDETDGVDEFLVLYDTDQGFIDYTALRDDELGMFLDKIESKCVLALFDVGFGGGVRRSTRQLPIGTRPDHADAFTDFLMEGKIVVLSSTEGEQCYECAELGHGAFTYFFLKGVEGEADEDKNLCVTVRELCDYLLREVPAYVEATIPGARQIPYVIGDPALMNLCILRLPSLPEGEVEARTEEDSVIISLGSRHSVQEGDRFEILRVYALPDGEKIEELLSIIEVVYVLDHDYSICQVVEHYSSLPIKLHDDM